MSITRRCAANLLAVTVLFSAGGLSASAWAAAASADVPYSTPTGITLVDESNNSQKFAYRRFGDAEGNPLFVMKPDAKGKHSCTGVCTTDFTPFTAPANAAAYDIWSIVSADGGVKQWAYQGQPVYLYKGAKPVSELLERNDDKEVWRVLDFSPENVIVAPSGIKLQSLEVAAGYGLVSADNGMVMYNFNGSPRNPAAWQPVYAPAVALPFGDFSITRREDGTAQWAYKGRPLYTYKEDYSPGDINGVFADSAAEVALAYKHFMPTQFAVRKPVARGPIMTTAEGLTVYTQGRYQLQYGGRSTRDGYYLAYSNAKAVGTRGCVDECLNEWRPVLAPADAQPRGLWEVATRADGKKQWVYKGAALYTYAADKKTGDVFGNNRHTYVYGDPNGTTDLTIAGGDRDGTGFDRGFGSGFYWHHVMLYTQEVSKN